MTGLRSESYLSLQYRIEPFGTTICFSQVVLEFVSIMSDYWYALSEIFAKHVRCSKNGVFALSVLQ